MGGGEARAAGCFWAGWLSRDMRGWAPAVVADSFPLTPRGVLRPWVGLLRAVAGGGWGVEAPADTVTADLARFKLRVDVAFEDPAPLLELWGPDAPSVLERATGMAAPTGWTESKGVMAAAVPLGTLPRFVVAGVATATLTANGAEAVDSAAANAVRVEWGEPRMGTDIDENTIPQESGLVPKAVSFAKGCYLGQELVARIDARGHVNRHLRSVEVAGTVTPPVGASVVGGDREVGVLSSVVAADEGRGPRALALLRREVIPGDEVLLRWNGGEATATVRDPPILTTA